MFLLYVFTNYLGFCDECKHHQMLTILLFTLIGSSVALPNEVSLECAACQLFAYALTKENTTSYAHIVPQSSVTFHCSNIPQCATSLTHCEILKRLAIEKANYIAGKNDTKIGELLSAIANDVSICHQDPHNAILIRQKETTKCTMCLLIYHFFEFMSNGITELPLVQLIPTILGFTCNKLYIINKNNTPAVCAALLGEGTAEAILHAFSESMGSFYNLIAVQTIGCPPYTTLFTQCKS